MHLIHNVRRLTVAMIIALIASLGAVAGVVTPAQAATTGWTCNSYRDITTCVSVDWTKQGDGTGVLLEGIQVWTSNGCSSLESSGGKYDPVTALYVHNSTQHVWNSWAWGAEGCNFYKDLSHAGADSGYMDVRVALKARINWYGDKTVYMGWTLRPDGTSYVTYNFNENA